MNINEIKSKIDSTDITWSCRFHPTEMIVQCKDHKIRYNSDTISVCPICREKSLLQIRSINREPTYKQLTQQMEEK